MRAIRNMLKRLRTDQSGLSMAELLVAGILTVIVFAVMGTMFMQVAKLTTTSNQVAGSNKNATNAANGITSVVRVATNVARLNNPAPLLAIEAGSNKTTLIVYSLSNTSPTVPAPTKVTFSYDSANARITETRCTGTLSGSYYSNFTTCTPFRVIGNDIAYTAAEQLFTYRDVNGVIIPMSGNLTDTQRALVASIVVTVRVLPTAPGSRVSVVTNTVVLRNIGLDTGT
ncbi:MAG: hypothetical protein ABI566_10000 [Pseudolysinimonas sp.]